MFVGTVVPPKMENVILIFVAKTDFVPKDARESLEDKISKRYRCPKCSHDTPAFKRIYAREFGKVVNSQRNQFLVVSCCRCGYSEFYDADILGYRKGIGEVLDFFFGT